MIRSWVVYNLQNERLNGEKIEWKTQNTDDVDEWIGYCCCYCILSIVHTIDFGRFSKTVVSVCVSVLSGKVTKWTSIVCFSSAFPLFLPSVFPFRSFSRLLSVSLSAMFLRCFLSIFSIIIDFCYRNTQLHWIISLCFIVRPSVSISLLPSSIKDPHNSMQTFFPNNSLYSMRLSLLRIINCAFKSQLSGTHHQRCHIAQPSTSQPKWNLFFYHHF